MSSEEAPEPKRSHKIEKSRKYDPIRIANLLLRHNFDVEKVAGSVGISVPRLMVFIGKSNHLMNLIEMRRQSLIYMAESNIQELLAAKDKEATFFVLKTLGKNFYSDKPIDNSIPQVNVNNLALMSDSALQSLIAQNKADLKQNIMLKSARMRDEQNSDE